jgi:cytoskeletal protein CcmA (bactofilin family)
MNLPQETELNIVSPHSTLEGKIHFEKTTRLHGRIKGDVKCAPGSTLIVTETGSIEGSVEADAMIIDGFVRGEIKALNQVRITRTGRFMGSLECKTFSVEFGAFFEGKSITKGPSD